MGLLPIPAPKLTQGASRAGFWRAAALYVGKQDVTHMIRWIPGKTRAQRH